MSHMDLFSLASISDLAMRRAALGERLEGLEAEAAAAAIEELLCREGAGRPGRDAVALAFATWLVRLHRYGGHGERERIRQGALEGGHEIAAALLDDGPPHKALAPKGRLPDTGMSETTSLPMGRFLYWIDISSGRISGSFPTRRDMEIRRGLQDRVLAHPSPFFVRRLLRATWLEVRDVLRIASRRPSTPALVFELATHDRWIGFAEVREALASNPFCPTGVALAMLPSLRTPALRRFPAAEELHPLVRHAATLLTT